MDRKALLVLACLCLGFGRKAAGGVPHTAYGTLRYADGSTPSSVTFSAIITSRPLEVLTQASYDCGYTSGIWRVQTGNFATSWSAGDVLRVLFSDGSGKTGSIEVTLTQEPGDNAGTTILTVPSAPYYKLSIPDMTGMRGNTVNVPVKFSRWAPVDSVVAYELTIGYDADVLLSVGATSAGTMTQNWGDPFSAPHEDEITLAGWTTNKDANRMVKDDSILVYVDFIVQGIPSSQTSNATLIRILRAKITTMDEENLEETIVSHTRTGALLVQENPEIVQKNVTLYPGLNLISLALVPEPNTIPEIWNDVPIDYAYGYIQGERPVTWKRNRPVNDLNFLDGLHAYFLKLNSVNTILWQVSGASLSIETPIIMYNGYNTTGYLPLVSDSLTHAFASLNPAYQYVYGIDNGIPKTWKRYRPIQDLNILKPNMGFWVNMDDSKNLIYPTEGYRVQKHKLITDFIDISHLPNDDLPIVTPWICDFWSYQQSTLSPGDTIRAFDSNNIFCGIAYVDQKGSFLLHVFGDDASTEDVDEGAVEGDTIHFNINNRIAQIMHGNPIWIDKDSKEIILEVVTGIEDDEPSLFPDVFLIKPNYPNPFNNKTYICYSIYIKEKVTIIIYDVFGNRVRILMNELLQEPGEYQITWDGTDEKDLPVSSGVYVVKYIIGFQGIAMKMLLIK